MTAFSIGVHGSSANRPGSVMASHLLTEFASWLIRPNHLNFHGLSQTETTASAYSLEDTTASPRGG
jgi:hypothetical protein